MLHYIKAIFDHQIMQKSANVLRNMKHFLTELCLSQNHLMTLLLLVILEVLVLEVHFEAPVLVPLVLTLGGLMLLAGTLTWCARVFARLVARVDAILRIVAKMAANVVGHLVVAKIVARVVAWTDLCYPKIVSPN